MTRKRSKQGSKIRSQARRRNLQARGLLTKCPLTCQCLCHDTGGGVHPHPGRPCPGKTKGQQT